MNRKTALLLAIVGLLVIQLSWTAAVDRRVSNVDDRVSALETDLEAGGAGGGFSAATNSSSGVIPAYDRERGDGVLVPYAVVEVERSGLFVDVANTTHDSSFQQAVRDAISAVEANWNVTTDDGLLVALETPSRWQYVSGESAGLSIALGTLATDSRYELRDGVTATGKVTERGTVGRVREVGAKVRAAREAGLDTIVVPPGQGVDVDGIRVVEATNLSQAADVALERIEPSARSPVATAAAQAPATSVP